VDNDLEEGEGKLWKSLKVSSRPPQGFKPAEVSIAKVGKFKLLPDPGVQEYVAALGRILIPAYQRELPDGTPHKIPFQFFVIQNAAPNAFALPNGTIAVHSGMLLLPENEAQFAAVLGHEIAHAVQEHTWRQMQYHKKKRVGLAIASAVASAYGAYSVSDLLNLVEGAVRSGHSRSLENQADRVGLEYMVAAGYDPREAPKVWRLMAQEYGVRPTDFFWSSHENHATRRSYLMNELKNNHRDLDYGTTVRNEEDFRWVQARVRAANEGKLKVRVR
jgi:predicted Zn-dependent protease